MNKTITSGSLHGALQPPCSKSYAQRALAAALLCQGHSVIRNIEYCDDTLSALRCIEALGADVEAPDQHTLAINGGLRPRNNAIFVGESGLATRMFTPICSLWHTPITIEGCGTLLQRDMQMVIEPLRRLGVTVEHHKGHLPFTVTGPISGGEVEVDGSLSSQFITGLLLTLPLAEGETTLRVANPVSRPYLDMTIDTAARFGVEICHNDYREFYIPAGQHYESTFFEIEGDWSAAAMMLVAGATAGEVTIHNVSMLSKQADTSICSALVRAGASLINESNSVTACRQPLQAFEFDATDSPDLFPALTALAASAEGVSVIRGTRRLENKESNRAHTLREEFGKLGIEVDLSEEDVMKIRGGEIRGGEVFSHHDHRIAMALAVAALNSHKPVVIRDAECVAKSYPRFFEDLESLIQK